MSGLPVQSPAPGFAGFAGVNRRIDVAAPAAGQEWRLPLPGGSWWRMLLGRARFTTSAAVANRFSGFEIFEPDNSLFFTFPSVAITAGRTSITNYASGSGSTNAGVNDIMSAVTVPDVFIPPGFVIASHTLNIDAGDQYDQIRLYLQEVDLGQDGALLGRPDEYIANLLGPEEG